jgi:alkanesulfonate monooxygenase SsuD/methylene tetrahydromethanopterin reductase-like flavin-dependent oxidoreductase (luciferase family)
VQFGFVLPGGSPRELVDAAVLAEDAGWDALFVWEGAYGPDAWSVLAAAAERTTRIKLGTMLTPLPWRRAWKVASQVATLDQLSSGRAILAVGLGAPETAGGATGDAQDRRERAKLLDDGIDLIAALWSGELHFEGDHIRIDLRDAPFGPFRPVQEPRPPIWVVGAWPRPKSMQRVLRCDGVLPNVMDPEFRPSTPDDVRGIVAWLREHGPHAQYDVIVEGETPPERAGAAEVVGPWREAGATWWLETRWVVADGLDAAEVVRERITAGPPTPS